MTWESQATAIADPAEKARVVRDAIALFTASADACRQAGHRIDIVSCGGSGTLPYCAMQPGITEIEAGGAIFSDVLYRERFHLDFPPALHLLASVTSRPTPTRIILDAGKKAMSSDGAMPAAARACRRAAAWAFRLSTRRWSWKRRAKLPRSATRCCSWSAMAIPRCICTRRLRQPAVAGSRRSGRSPLAGRIR